MSSSDSRRITLIGFVALSCLVSSAYGQEPPVLQLGTRVRAHIAERSQGETQNKTLTGKLLGLSETTLTLDTSHPGPPVVLPRQDIAKLEASLRQGKSGGGALIGLGIGAAAGALLGFALGDDQSPIAIFTAREKAGMLAFLLGAVGAQIGSTVAPREQWQVVPPDGIRLGFDSAIRRGHGISVALRF